MTPLGAFKPLHDASPAAAEYYRHIVQNMPAAVYVCDALGRIVLYNHAAAALWGREPELGKDAWCGSWRIFRPDGSPMSLDACPMAVALREGRPVRGEEIVIERPDGTRRRVLAHPEPIRDAAGAVVGAVNMLVDVTDQRHAEQAQALLAAIVEGSDDAIVSKTLEGVVTSWNSGARRIFGYTSDEAVGRPITMLIPPDRLAEETHILSRLRRGERIEHYETVRVAKDGRLVEVSLTVSPVRDHTGHVIGVSKIARDITAQKATEQALRESESRYRTLAESMPFVVWQTDAQGELSYANHYFQNYSGWAAEDLRKGDVWELVHPDDRAGVKERFGRSVRTREPFRCAVRLRRWDGAWRWFEGAAEAVLSDDRPPARWIGAAIDIDDRRRAESGLAAVRDDLAVQVAGLTRLHELSTALAATRQLRPALQIVLKAIADLHGTDRGLLSMYDAASGELYEGASLRFDEPSLRQLARLTPGPRAGACGSSFYTRKRVIVEDTETDPCFAEFREAARALGFRSVHSTPILTRSGEILGVLSVHFPSPRSPSEREVQFADMCARLAADAIEAARYEEELESHREHLERMVEERTREVEESHHRLRHSERMALLGTLSAGLGHDMGNLLMPVRVRIESLENAGLTGVLAEDVRAIKASAEYLQRLSNGLRLLALDPDRPRRREATEVRAWWADAEPVFKNGLPRGIMLTAMMPEGACWVDMAKPAMTQAVFNLVQNAGDTLRARGSGRVTVAVRADEQWLRISVTDDGPGMSESVRQHCMEPFFTTKSRGISTGLGLVLVGGLVRDAGGMVEIESELGKGTTFTLSLPLAAPPPDTARAAGVALVRLQDPRMRSIVATELGSLSFEIRTDSVTNIDRSPDIVVLDHDSDHAIRCAREGARVVLFDERSHDLPGVTVLGARPSIHIIREALRQAAGYSPAEAGRR